MKVLLIAVNAKFIHTSPAVRYLAASCMNLGMEIKIKEFTINDRINNIVGDITAEKADVVAFSCYIWNIGMILHISEILKKVYPDIKTVLGGPEVSFDSLEMMQKHDFIDYILVGEGEVSFPELMGHIINQKCEDSCKYQAPDYIGGLVYRYEDRNGSAGGTIIKSSTANELIKDLDKLPSPYQGSLMEGLKNRIAYIESSRGCPFSCSYCLSSAVEGVRYFSLERVKEELEALIEAGVKQIKFVDRTFNCNKARAMEIFKLILSLNANINFHFEVAADLFDEEMLLFLKTIPEGLFQFEIGVQSTNIGTLQLVNRKTHLERLYSNVEKLREAGNIHLHLDLIAGLPGEDLESFRRSFIKVYGLRPHQLQLGFLKLLKGSGIRQNSEKWGYVYDSNPPYEVLKNDFLSFEELQKLKDLEELVEIYYNSGKFKTSLDFLVNYCSQRAETGSYDFYNDLVRYWRNNSLFTINPGNRGIYEALIKFGEGLLKGKDELPVLFRELIKYDYLSFEKNTRLPEGMTRINPPSFKEKCFDFLKKEANVQKFLPVFTGIPAKQIFKEVHFELFSTDITPFCEKIINIHEEYSGDFGNINCLKNNNVMILFNYSVRDPVTARYETILIDEFEGGNFA